MRRAGQFFRNSFTNGRMLGIRNLSTPALKVAQVKVPQRISQEFYNLTLEHLKKSIDLDAPSEPMTVEEGNIGAKILAELIKSDPQTHDSFEQVKEDPDLTGIVISGITVSNFTKEELPSEISHLKNPQLIKKLRPNEIATYAYGSVAGINPTDYMVAGSIVTPVFPAKKSYHSNTSYLSGKELSWHNDGWSDKAARYVILLGIVGKKETLTEIVDARDIITHFRKSKKQSYLDVLGKLSDQIDFAENYGPQVTILDSSGKINYAQYGKFTAILESDEAILGEAIWFLNDLLHSNKIPSYKLSIGKGDALIQRNDRGLHRKTTKEPTGAVESSIGERLLLRAHGTPNEKS